MARVNVDQRALSDPRFKILSDQLGLPDADAALGRMIRLWNECQERETYELSATVIGSVLRFNDAANALVVAELARQRKNGSFYIRGTKGRVEWLKKRRRDGQKGGKLGGRPRKPLGVDKKQRAETPPAPAPAPAPALELKTPIPPRAPRAARGREEAPPGFKRAWLLYPHFENRSRRGKSLTVWTRRGLEAHSGAIERRVELEAAGADWTRDGGRFVPGMQVWLASVDLEPPTAAGERREPRLGEVTNRLLTAQEKAR